MNATVTEQFRVEKDALGNVEVPAERLWGGQTRRSHVNFPIASSVSAGDGRLSEPWAF